MDEFDLFAQHPKQALLYNLFDAAQSAQNPMAVIGLTCRLDTLDLLEKRVKSRFSHRQIYLFPSSNFGQFIEIARSSLLLPEKPENKVFNDSLDDLFQDPTVNGILRRIFDISKDIRMFHKICVSWKRALSMVIVLTHTSFHLCVNLVNHNLTCPHKISWKQV